MNIFNEEKKKEKEKKEESEVFARCWTCFGNCLRGYNSSHCMTDEDIDKLGN